MITLSTSLEDIKKAAEILKNGGLVAFPTETVYGLGANGLSPEAAKKIYRAKGRPSDNPLILHVATKEDVDELVETIPDYAQKLMEAFWPGPLTFILPKKDVVPKESTGGLATVAVRLPAHPIAQRLIKEAGLPLAAPSANTSGRPSPTAASHVKVDLSDKIDALIDGGNTEVGLESTVVDATGAVPVILRPGGITKEAIEETLGISLSEESLKKGEAPRAPGMKYRHYAPETPVVLVDTKEILEQVQSTPKAALLAASPLCKLAEGVLSYDLGESDVKAAQRLFDGLRTLDSFQPSVIFTHPWEEKGMGVALMNRLKKVSSEAQDVYNIKEDL